MISADLAHNSTAIPQHHWSYPEWKSTLTKVHGVVFVLAWLFFVPVAVGAARYFRDTLTKYTPMGMRLWFHVHRTFNIVAAVLMIVGLVCIFVAHEWRWLGPKVGGERNNSATAYHTMFGLFSVLLAWLQPLNSLLRCGPNHKLRALFNWTHRFLGLISWLFAAATIMIACKFFAWEFVNSHVAIATCGVAIGVIGFCVLVSEMIAFRARRSHQKRDPEKTHWTTFMQSTVIGFSSATLLILVTILCVLIGVRT